MFIGSILTINVRTNMSPGNPDSPRLIKSEPTPDVQSHTPPPLGPICDHGCEELFRLAAVKRFLIRSDPRPPSEVFDEAKARFDAHRAECPSDGCTKNRQERAKMQALYLQHPGKYLEH